jgi:hypothetical protein
MFMLRSAEKSLAVLIRHVPYLEIYGYNVGLIPMAHVADNAGLPPMLHLEALKREVSDKRSIIERRESAESAGVFRANRPRRGPTTDMTGVCTKIYKFTQGLLYQRQILVRTIKDLENDQPLQQRGIIDADGNRIVLEKANLWLLKRLMAHDDTILVTMGMPLGEDDAVPSPPALPPPQPLRLYSYV